MPWAHEWLRLRRGICLSVAPSYTLNTNYSKLAHRRIRTSFLLNETASEPWGTGPDYVVVADASSVRECNPIGNLHSIGRSMADDLKQI
ncbi:MAG: hypothetical protein SFY80_02575 [Verrucomicrobiota bacterium]|nr:hypothetical protein [Verrucomicrobiota bacterium]